MRWLFAAAVLGLACAPPATAVSCDLELSETGTARVLVVGHRVTLADGASYASFEESFRRHLPAIRGCLSASRPNVIVFPEDSGLVAWFIGRQGALGRGAGDIGTAFNLLYAGAFRASDAYRERFPGISAARALTLAASDRAWRAMDTTFGRIARETGSWVVTSANLPRSLRSTAPEDLPFRDPDGLGGAYVAQTPEVFNTGLVYGPTGQRAGRVDKVYLTDPELETIDLSTPSVASMDVVPLPFTKLGIAISRDAFYPPFMQRLDELGAELVVQPEAFSGWTVEQEPGDWPAEVILASSWSMTQKYAAVRFAAMPVLTGNIFTEVFDGQAWIASQAVPGGKAKAPVGDQPAPGLDVVGPWVAEDDLTLPQADRRARLRARGLTLLPGGSAAGETIDSLIGADLDLRGEGQLPVKPVTPAPGTPSVSVAPAPAGHQTDPVVAWDGVGHLYAAWTDTRSGTARIMFATSLDDGATWSTAVVVAAGGAQRRPAISAAGDGMVVIAWQEERGDVEQVRVARSADRGALFGAVWLEESDAAQWEPALVVFADGTEAVAWTDFRAGVAPQVRLRCSSAPSRPIDASTATLPREQSSQLQPSLAGRSLDALALGWIDHRDHNWHVRVARGALCTGPVESTQVSPSSDHEVLAADPQVSAAPDGSFAVAWDEIRDRRGIYDVRWATSSGSDWVEHTLPRLEAGRFRPSPFFAAGWRVLLQSQASVKNGLWLVSGPEITRFDDTGTSTNQLWRPRTAMRADGSKGVVVFVDDRSGWRRVRASGL